MNKFVNSLKFSIKPLALLGLILMISLPQLSSAQIVEEIIQLDTITEKMRVVYRPSFTNTSSYEKKIGVFPSDTSIIAIEKTYLRGRLNGIYKVYYPSGKLKVKAVFANGNPNGEFTWFDEKGLIRIKGMYKDSIKHGYWAYKYMKVYGRYNKGKKHKQWYMRDANNQKVKSFYKHGNLIKGDGFGDDKVKQLNKEFGNQDSVVVQNSGNDTVINEVILENAVDDRYLQAIDFLKNNYIFRTTIKEHFGDGFKNLRLFKKNYTHNIFQIKISSHGPALGITPFLAKSTAGQLKAVRIDSLIKAEGQAIKTAFSTENDNALLSSYSSKSKTNITVFFSELSNNLMRIDIIWNKEEQAFNNDQELYQQLKARAMDFKVLLFFDQNGQLAAAEYQ